MDRSQRRSDRLAKQRRRAGKSSREMSVGEALDADTHEVEATNLAEARAMNSARKAAALRESQTPRVAKRNKHMCVLTCINALMNVNPFYCY